MRKEGVQCEKWPARLSSQLACHSRYRIYLYKFRRCVNQNIQSHRETSHPSSISQNYIPRHYSKVDSLEPNKNSPLSLLQEQRVYLSFLLYLFESLLRIRPRQPILLQCSRFVDPATLQDCCPTFQGRVQVCSNRREIKLL